MVQHGASPSLVDPPLNAPALIDRRKKERTTELVVAALKAGLRGIDTASQPKVSCDHPESLLILLHTVLTCLTARSTTGRLSCGIVLRLREDLVGKAIQQVIKEGLLKRDDLYIQTK